MKEKNQRGGKGEESAIYIFISLIGSVGESKMRIAPTTYLGSAQ